MRTASFLFCLTICLLHFALSSRNWCLKMLLLPLTTDFYMQVELKTLSKTILRKFPPDILDILKSQKSTLTPFKEKRTWHDTWTWAFWFLFQTSYWQLPDEHQCALKHHEHNFLGYYQVDTFTIGWSGATWMMNWYAGMTQCCNTSLVISPSCVAGSGGNVNPSSKCSSYMFNCQKNISFSDQIIRFRLKSMTGQ